MLSHTISLFDLKYFKLARVIAMLSFVVVITACNSVETRYGFAKRDNTVKAYDKFIENFPDSKFVGDAKQRKAEVILRNKERRAKWVIEAKKRKLRQQKRNKQIARWKIKLAKNTKERIKKGSSAPERPNDPGYPIVYCQVSNLNDAVLAVNFPYTRGGFLNIGYHHYICGNTEAGKKVLHWRQWYCNNINENYNCVVGRWKKGEPTFNGVARKQKEIIKMQRGQPGLEYRLMHSYEVN